MKLTRFGETNRNIKVCNNDSDKSTYKKNYDPAYIYDLPYKDFVSNTKSISVKTDNNQMIDKSSWTRCGYGEAGSEICGSMLEGSESMFTCINTSSTTTRNMIGQLQVPNNSTNFSVIFCKWSVEVCPVRGSCFMRS